MSAVDELIETAARVAGEKVAARLLADIEQHVERAVDRVLERRQADALLPLHKIIGGTAAKARMMLKRHPDLAALGVPESTYTIKFKPGTKSKLAGEECTATRLKFRRADVDVWIAMQKQKRGGGR